MSPYHYLGAGGTKKDLLHTTTISEKNRLEIWKRIRSIILLIWLCFETEVSLFLGWYHYLGIIHVLWSSQIDGRRKFSDSTSIKIFLIDFWPGTDSLTQNEHYLAFRGHLPGYFLSNVMPFQCLIATELLLLSLSSFSAKASYHDMIS